jgi:hypothetical protein
MCFFKYLIVLTFLFISHQAFAECLVDINAAFESNLAEPPIRICATNSSFGSDKCIFNIYNQQKNSSGWLMFGTTTGETCTSVTKLDAEYSCTTAVCPVTEFQACPSSYQKGMYNGQLSCVRIKENKILNCTSEICDNPENLRCPINYKKGVVNGAVVCAKSSIDLDEPEPTECNPDENDCVVSAVNDAKNGIVGAISDLSNSISDSIEKLWENIENYLNEQGNGSNSDGDGDNNNNGGPVDTGGLTADVPFVQLEQKQFKEDLFSHNASCPPDNTLSMSFAGKNFSYTFKYQKFCDGLSILGLFILAFAYLFAANIVVRA